MKEWRQIVLGAVALWGGLSVFGCAGRLVGEGIGAVRGASGKFVALSASPALTRYKGMKIESVTVTSGLQTPADLPSMLREEFAKAARKAGLAPDGTPALVLGAEVVNYESAGIADTAIGPLEEIIVRVRLTDAESTELVAAANLIGRAKSVTAGGPKNLSEGAGKALSKWLKEGGLTDEEEEGDRPRGKKRRE